MLVELTEEELEGEVAWSEYCEWWEEFGTPEGSTQYGSY